MKRSLKVDVQNGISRVHYRARDWDEACRIALSFEESPPDGYRLRASTVRRRADSGRATNLEMIFEWVCPDVPQFGLNEAYEFFRSELMDPSRSEPRLPEAPPSE